MNRKTISMICAALAALPSLAAREGAPSVSGVRVDRSAGRLLVSMSIDAAGLGSKSNSEAWLTPVLTQLPDSGAARSLRLPPVFVGGRNRYYLALRRGLDVPMYRGGTIPYEASVAWEPWMERAVLALESDERGCCGSPKGVSYSAVDTIDFVPRVFRPQFLYVRPEAEALKERSVSGSAFIDFPVNETAIRPDYRSNPRELAAIRATVDSVRLDPDVTVREMAFRGFASPEGPYANNARLAKGRTEALRDYVQGMCRVDPSVVRASYQPEDWEGLRSYVESSALEGRDAILALIDGSMSPDDKEAALRREFPAQYAFLLREVYPRLRRTDYSVSYSIRSYTDPADMLRLVYTRPRNLSLNEFFIAAQSVEPGSEAFNYIFETAARMYPDDEAANLNAANAAMQQGALDNAAAYLANAGDGPDAVYARGLLAALRGSYGEALELLRQAARLKVAPAVDAITQIDGIIAFNEKTNNNNYN